MSFLAYYTILVALCWIGLFLVVAPGEGEYEQANHSYWAAGFMVLTVADIVGWIAFLLNKVF